MRISNHPIGAILLSTLSFPLFVHAATIDCSHVLVKKTSFDLSKLAGPRSVLHSIEHGNGESFTNTTYTIDICAPLRPAKDVKNKDERCPVNTRICAIERFVKGKDIDTIQAAFPVAGDLREQGGKPMDPQWLLLKDSTSHEDSQKQGLSVELNGGFKTIDGKKKAQKAVVEFLCHDWRTGTENLYDPEDKYEEGKEKARREEGEKKDGDEKKADDEDKTTPSLEFVRYDQSNAEVDVLRLKWRTKYACENAKDDKDTETSAHWGFFTWFILIAFLGTAAYLIFGSWLNYNRYGARGWDLVPHGDAIRDVPYMMKDWTRKVMSSVQGGGRGGYAAV